MSPSLYALQEVDDKPTASSSRPNRMIGTAILLATFALVLTFCLQQPSKDIPPQRQSAFPTTSKALSDYPLTPIAPDGVVAPVPVNPSFTYRFQDAINGQAGSAISPFTSCYSSNAWMLSYDDGPSPYTPQLLSDLKSRGIKATFFVTGARTRLYPEILQQVAADGHEIGIHTWAHIELGLLTPEQIVSEVMWTWSLVKEITGLECRLFRPPLGVTNPTISKLLNGMGFSAIINFNADSNDWRDEGASVQSFFSQWTFTSPLSSRISLQHDIRAGPVSNAHYGMDAVIKAGYTTVVASACVGVSAYGPLNGKVVLGDSITNSTVSNSTASTSTATSVATSTATSSGSFTLTASQTGAQSTATSLPPKNDCLKNSASYIVSLMGFLFNLLLV